MDQDIEDDPGAYEATGKRPDPNIDFRRASNLDIFFRRHALSLTTQVIPGDVSNLVEWQPGDIVVFGNGGHIGIISDRRRPDGVPLLIHNAGPWAKRETSCCATPARLPATTVGGDALSLIR